MQKIFPLTLSLLWSIALAAAGFGSAIARQAPTSEDGPGVTSGFYRNVDKTTVYRVLDGVVCGIVSEDQLRALGASHKSVHVVGDSVDLLNGKASAPSCPWPDGLYRKRGGDYILKISDGNACILPSTDEPVHMVTSDRQVLEGKTFRGRCKD